jgi:hypothetical protein
MDEFDDRCRRSGKTRRSVDAYPDFESVIRNHRLLADGCSIGRAQEARPVSVIIAAGGLDVCIHTA